ncbi:putative tricarboxylic transport membrane protein [Psychrobacillus psychrotolerans]|uniref:Putative tricarboxylic transport membrane protein n=1 Tax=Psychrobacillus psychrotolerans TaxID=126156 RepID=A0A1I5UVW3_9BACI|nr:tripartite tricarboxylate transporter permease [Psychrobacillus psychrotolerans]SFP99395.1 putative tricarboxylic transport membrane protein [Psychrobacillus psychrotolerans]
MDAITNLTNGFASALSLEMLLVCFIGVLVGQVTGVLPGIGPTGAMAILLPLSFGMDPGAGLIMLAGIYYGSMYGGSITSILVNLPGEAASLVTTLDGYQMARKGRGGAALSIAAIGSWIAGTLAIVGLMFFAPVLANAALAFGPPEFFGLGLFGLIVLSNLTGGSFGKSVLMVIIGLMLSTVGVDLVTGDDRLTFGVLELSKGIDLVPVVMGLFGLAEIFSVAMAPYQNSKMIKVKLKEMYPNKQEAKRSVWPIIRGTLVGFPMGLLPGPAGFMSTLISYKLEKQLSRQPDEFGKGAIEGVAGPESANNAASTSAMIPFLALGFPFSPPTALLLGGLLVHGITPGPMFISQHGDLFWLVVASMYIGNVMLLVLNLPLVGVFASLTRVPVKILMPIITGIMFIGAYSINNSIFDLWIMLAFGIAGFIIKYCGYNPAPLVVGLVLGTVFEEGLRQGLMMTEGNFLMFFERPITATLLGISIVIVILNVLKIALPLKKSSASNKQ